MIRVDPSRLGTLDPISFGDSDSLRVGDWVLALGNPLDLNFTVTAGIVSAKGRNLNILRTSASQNSLEAFIQTDAAINPGNSGGPLVDLLGRVVGVNGAIETTTGFFSGAGFAIPINLARKVADDLIQYGAVHRPRLGVSIQDVNSADAELYKLPSISGAEISSVSPGMSADKAGLHMGDVVVALNGQAIGGVTELQDHVARLKTGDKIRLGIIRYGQSLEKTITLTEEFESGAKKVAAASPPKVSGVERMGFSVLPAPRDAAVKVGLETEATLAISAVDPFGPAYEAQLPSGPNIVLVSINGQDVHSVKDVEKIADGLKPGQIVSVVVLNVGPDAAPTIFNYRMR